MRYVLEGSVQKADEQVRITAQLIDATTGGHLWSERYDRPLQRHLCPARRDRAEDRDDAEAAAHLAGARVHRAQTHGQPGGL